MGIITRLAGGFLAAALAVPALAQDVPELRAATLQIGTVNWELATIEDRGLDSENGFDLVIQEYADNGATRVALAGGEADMVVADWLWVATQRAAGRDYVFIPYSTAVGGVMVPGDSAAETLQDLEGEQIGIAGGPVDKSWLILRAYAQQEYDMDLAAETEQVYGAPPLIMKTAMQGETQGAINYWHFMAKMKAAGMRELISVATAAEALGLDPDTPLLGYVVTGDFARENPDVVEGLARASRAAKDLLASDDAVWEDLRPQMNAADDAEFEALKEGWIAGIPPEGPVDEAAAARMFDLMAELGGPELVGQAETLPEGVFYDLSF
ncbi:ABC transporter substrate-binding protein [uncultured Jannaschia sp.]|uniref:ABC transporter substrate-binding protein n=1 Tax=uncultured Jannaschia sp. TaxID=293347 RepID=UPI0026045064|nr:ABC transporter substrate-binding protein [uncultured Jannaschia sp.]